MLSLNVSINSLIRLRYLTVCLFQLAIGLKVYAVPLVVSNGQVVFDWGRLVLRYNGYTIPDAKNSLQFADLEKSAFFKGLSLVRAPLKDLYKSFLAENELTNKVKEGDKLRPLYERYSFIVDREFFANSGLSVGIRSPMTRLFALPEHYFRPVPVKAEGGH